jgi:hypothetical protein
MREWNGRVRQACQAFVSVYPRFDGEIISSIPYGIAMLEPNKFGLNLAKGLSMTRRIQLALGQVNAGPKKRRHI